jgi:glycine C-acetyltransferase/8-amino-7-oxononanoate synthase
VTGAIAPLPEYADVLCAYDNALVWIDDAHGVGVLGERGRGTFDHWKLASPNRYLAGTLSKAFGGLGGFVPGSADFTDRIDRSERIPEGASPPSIGAVAGSAMGIRILSEHPEMRVRLRENVVHLRTGLAGAGLDTGNTPVPIVCIAGREGLDLKRLSEKLREAGIVVTHLSPHGYSDAPEVETIRIAVFSTHSSDQIDRLVHEIARWV